MSENILLIPIPKEEWIQLLNLQQQILEQLKSNEPARTSLSNYITAVEFMEAVRIRRSKFDQLVATNKIKTIKKKRKIYVPISEIDRFFTDRNIL